MTTPKTPLTPQTWVEVNEDDYAAQSTPVPALGTPPAKRSIFQRATKVKVADYTLAGPTYFERHPERYAQVQASPQDRVREEVARGEVKRSASALGTVTGRKSQLPDLSTPRKATLKKEKPVPVVRRFVTSVRD